ncbi:MAG: PEP-CTERM sorting domain-containing protein [Verrucomicrobiales bacterium]
MRRTTIAAILLATSLCSTKAAVVWTGGTSTDPFEDSNWDFSGSAETAVDSNVSIEDDITITNGNIEIPNLAGQVRLQIGNGFTMTLDNSILGVVAGGNDGVGGQPSGTGVTVNVTNGSQLNPFFVVNAVTVNVDASSSASFGGGGTPINISTVNLTPGSSLTLASLAEFTEQGAKIFVNGVSFSEDTSILSFSGNTGTAIPEPTGLALLGLAGLACCLRRRR